MSFVNLNSILPVAAWGCAYGTSLYGTSKAVLSVGEMAGTLYKFSTNSWSDKEFKVQELKPFISDVTVRKGNTSITQEGHLKSLMKGVAWCVAGLAIRQLAAYTVSEKCPAFIEDGIRNLGWQRVSSPVIERIVDFMNLYSPFRIVLL